jgi:peptidyl-prolyl cis-trans isomerase SurA
LRECNTNDNLITFATLNKKTKNKNMKNTILSKTLIISFALLSSVAIAQTNNDAVLMTVGNKKVTVSEFESVYHKNNPKETTADPKSLREYLELFETFKMKVNDAEATGLDTAKSFRDELAGYRKQLAQPYLTDKDVNDKLLHETYNRLQEDVHAQHILIKISESALPKDTLEAYTRIMLVRDVCSGKTITPAQIADYENILKKAIPLGGKATHTDSTIYKNLLEEVKTLAKAKGGKENFENIAKLTVPNTDRETIWKGQPTKSLSDDPSAKDNGGDLGYFTALQMVFPFENVAYGTKTGDISMPVRTRYGYHIIKVVDRRKAQGELLTAHIMVKTMPNMSKDDSLNAYKKIMQIYDTLKSGAKKFDDMALKYSDDKQSAKKGGELPWFGTYKMPPEFEKAAFAIPNKGDICAPFRTKYGWHIILLKDKRGLASFDDMKNELKGKVTKDSRSQAGRESLIAKLKTEYKFKENTKLRDEFYKVLDSSYFEGKWDGAKAKALNKVMFNLNDKNFNQTDFTAYLTNHQSKRPAGDFVMTVNNMYKQFVDESVINYEEARLDTKYPEFKALMTEYRDGILLFQLTDEKVWSKAVKDTTGSKEFYEKNKTNYMWEERADATVYSCSDDKVAKKVHDMLKKKKTDKEIIDAINKDSQLNLSVDSKIFNKGENEYVDKNWKEGTSDDIKSDKKVIIVVTNKIIKPQPKEYADARGMVTADYQSYLEKEWIASLKSKYKVTVDEKVLATVK